MNDKPLSFVITTRQKILGVALILLVILIIISNITLIFLVHHSAKRVNKEFTKFQILKKAPYYIELAPPIEESGKIVSPQYSFGISQEGDNEKDENTLIYSKQKIPYEQLYELAEKVVCELPEIQPHPDVIKLIVETAITETEGGNYYDTTNLGGLGLTQFSHKTAKFLLDHLSKNKPHIYEAVQKYKQDHLSFRENIIHNLQYNIALCASYYHFHKGEDLYKTSKTLKQRAFLWKDVYNTKEGKGTPEIYLRRVKEYLKDGE